jgi:carbon storage regulator
MLVLSRKLGESIMINDDIEVIVLGIDGDIVKLGITAPREVIVFRKEIYLAIQQSNTEAKEIQPSPKKLGEMFKKQRNSEKMNE